MKLIQKSIWLSIVCAIDMLCWARIELAISIEDTNLFSKWVLLQT